MKICVFGLWHLGTVTAACLASKGCEVIGLDADRKVVEELKKGKPPIYETGLSELIGGGISSGKLAFTTDPKIALQNADLLWVAFDTPVKQNDEGDPGVVIQQVVKIFPFIQDKQIVLISSQLPVRSTTNLATKFQKRFPQKKVSFFYSPENLRLGKAIETFLNAERVIVGSAGGRKNDFLEPLFCLWTDNIIWMSVESAEMVKHAVNAYLATSIAFTNEISSICEKIGADAGEVEQGLRSESRIGKKAYVKAGEAFAGGTLARDLNFLSLLGKKNKVETFLIRNVSTSNDLHKGWALRKLKECFKNLSQKKIAILGLSYKSGSDVIRQSNALVIAELLKKHKASAVGFDRFVKKLPNSLASKIRLVDSYEKALKDADAVLITAEFGKDTELLPAQIERMRERIVLDPNGFYPNLKNNPEIRYFSVGKL